jgi:hypothetical protein
MNTQLIQGTGKSSASPDNSGVFGVISSALQTTGRKLGCWDASRFADHGDMRQIEPDPSVTRETLAYAFAAH